MANFKSSLTGSQLNDALLQVEARIPEGWAVGTNNGVPVSSGSPYYNNNAKYYAALAQAAVPSSTEGAVFFSKAQTLTATQQSQARANIKAGGSNPNILRNGFFKINQIDFTSTTSKVSGAYLFDGWRSFMGNNPSSGQIALSADGLTITNGGVSGQTVGVLQLFGDGGASLRGKTLTASVLFADGTVDSGTLTLSDTATGGTVYFVNRSGLYRIAFTHNTTGGYFRFEVFSGQSYTIKAFKLEEGSVSTLAANSIPTDYNDELQRCLPYFQRIYIYNSRGWLIGYSDTSTTVRIIMPLLAPMRAYPSMTLGLKSGIGVTNGVSSKLISSIALNNAPTIPNGASFSTVLLTGTGTDIPTGVLLVYFNGTNNYIDFNAEP